ncbi:STAS domain-containing protein [Sphaerisporangium corydalis]|uniref:Anti-sigma factor antagonist n=1 Tax=Sphaerisporangium corydalis TaxID=1441875 RepID=A0ABV9EG47_9ACTN|nr:STAS domain-containing protein [Sphaerisporangium corydalis]
MYALVVLVAQVNGLMIITVQGELDMAGKPVLRAGVDHAIHAGDGPLVIEMSRVSFIDAQGLSALVMCRRHATDSGRLLSLTRVPPKVRRLLRLTMLEHTFTITAHPGLPDPSALTLRPLSRRP